MKESVKSYLALMAKGKPFAYYRLPDEKTVYRVGDSRGGVSILWDIAHFNDRKGFVIAPFCSRTTPIVLIETTRKEKMQDAEEFAVTDVPDSYAPPTVGYSNCFNLFSEALRKERYDKLVLSRCLTVDRPRDFHPLAAFYNACARYPHSFVYLVFTPVTGIWMGSSPEVLLSGKNGKWHTIALAGTQSLQDGKLPLEWDEKNRQEQEYVSAYIRKQLESFRIEYTESKPYPAYAGTLSHLRTDFNFSLDRDQYIGGLLKSLHPTPAVCGLPKKKAYHFILENEGYDRGYYSGFVGMLDPKGETELYVNLRCMHVKDETLQLYAGGGLLASSVLEDEWMETEKKMQMMKRLVMCQ